MRPKNINIDLADVDANGVFEDQTLGGAGNFTLNGAGVTGGAWVSPDGFAKQIGLESSGNLSGVNITLTGFADIHRNLPLTETLAGPNNTTVETTNYFAVITSISASGAVGTNIEAGPVDEAVSPIIPLDPYGGEIGFGCYVTGTISYTVQHTFDKLTAANFPYNWADNDDTDLVNATATKNGNFQQIPTAMQVKINSYSSGAALELGITQKRS